MADLARIKRNVAKMAAMNAPESDIDGYIASEGVSIDDVRNYKPLAKTQETPQPEETGLQTGLQKIAQLNPINWLENQVKEAIADPQKKLDEYSGAILNFDKGYSFGLGKEAWGSAGGAVGGARAGLVNALNGGSLGDIWEGAKIGTENQEELNDLQNRYAEENPNSAMVLQLAGMIANPASRLGANWIMNSGNAAKGANMLQKALGLAKKSAVGSAVGGAEVLANAVGQEDNYDAFKNNIRENLGTGAAFGAAFPPLAALAKQGPLLVGKLSKGVRNYIDRSPRLSSFLSRSADEIEEATRKMAPNGYGTKTSIGDAAQALAAEGAAAIEKQTAQKYDQAYQLTNRKAPAIINKSVSEIDELATELDKGSRNYLQKIKDELTEGLNTEQMGAVKRRIGKDVDTGTLGLTPNQQSRLYEGIKNDVYDSLARAAVPGKADVVRRNLAAADAFNTEMQTKGSPYKVLQNLAKAGVEPATVGDRVLRMATDMKGNNKTLKTLLTTAGNASDLRQELIRNIATKKDFNKLSPAAKEMIYEEWLPEAERLFNKSPADELVRAINEWSGKFANVPGSYSIPYWVHLLSQSEND